MSDFYYRANQPLARAILETVVYFDLFSYPLTTFEIWRNLRLKQKIAYFAVLRELADNHELASRLDFKNGVWFLKATVENIAYERNQRYLFSKYKIDQARSFAKSIGWIPGLRAIYACNTLGFMGAKESSDIDFFIVVMRGRIWTVRFFAVLLAKLFFKRPQGKDNKDTICLSFFATHDARLSSVALPPEDVYYEYWLRNLLPILLRLKVQKRGKLGDLLERILKSVQLRILPASLKALANQEAGVVISDEFLKFHANDRRAHFRQEFSRRFAQVAG
ncbi:hypothetical protein HY477_00640 [Candidatus Uhrbacteria bacterium]|nr:hypothetical protein [Candidatus Uhrbacteria bacterium]